MLRHSKAGIEAARCAVLLVTPALYRRIGSGLVYASDHIGATAQQRSSKARFRRGNVGIEAARCAVLLVTRRRGIATDQRGYNVDGAAICFAVLLAWLRRGVAAAWDHCINISNMLTSCLGAAARERGGVGALHYI